MFEYRVSLESFMGCNFTSVIDWLENNYGYPKIRSHWNKENIKEILWNLELENADDLESMVAVFKNKEDAILFKLTWMGMDELGT